MLERACKAIQLPDQQNVECTAPRSCHQQIEFGPAILGARDAAIHVLASDGPTTGLHEGTEFTQLQLRVLMPVVGADTSIQGYSFGRCGRSKNLLCRRLLSR